jgi:hypothetical protein
MPDLTTYEYHDGELLSAIARLTVQGCKTPDLLKQLLDGLPDNLREIGETISRNEKTGMASDFLRWAAREIETGQIEPKSEPCKSCPEQQDCSF